MASSAASVRKVISATGRPPLDSARHSGTASAASSTLMTGTSPARDSFSIISMVLSSLINDKVVFPA